MLWCLSRSKESTPKLCSLEKQSVHSVARMNVQCGSVVVVGGARRDMTIYGTSENHTYSLESSLEISLPEAEASEVPSLSLQVDAVESSKVDSRLKLEGLRVYEQAEDDIALLLARKTAPETGSGLRPFTSRLFSGLKDVVGDVSSDLAVEA